MGTLWELEGSHDNVVGTCRVPWKLCGNFVGTSWLSWELVRTSWELRGSHGNFVGTWKVPCH